MTNEDVLQGPLEWGERPNLLPARFGETLAFGMLKKAPANLASTSDGCYSPWCTCCAGRQSWCTPAHTLEEAWTTQLSSGLL